ncbi:hypothetical protein Tco_1556422 [Tanacetum coccineum]
MSSPEHISPLPAISPFLCTDSSEAPDSSDGPLSQDPYVATIARWRSKVTTSPSSSSEFPISSVTTSLGIHRRSAILIRPGEAIPFGRPYRTHLNGPHHHSSSSSSSSDSSPVHSLGLDASDQAHSGPSTRDVSPRLCYPPRRAPRRSEAFRRWCAAPLSTLYPPTTSESSSGDSSERPLHSSSHSARPSRKRCRSPVDSLPLSTLVMQFVPKGESVEVFGMAIPDPLITEAIQQSSYYPKYLKMVAENTKKTPQGSASVQPATQRATPKKPTTTTPVKQTKPAPPPTKKPSKRKLPQKVRKGKPAFQLVDEEDEARQDDDPDLDLAKKLSLEAHQEKGEEEGNDADLERAIKLSLDPTFLPQGRAPVGGVTIRDPVSETTSKLHEVVGKGKAVVSEEQVAHSLIDMSKKKRTTDQFILVRRDQTPPDSTTGPSSQPEDDTSEKVIHESSSTSDSERTESETETAAPKGDKDQGEVDSSTVTSGVSIPVSVPEKAHEALAGPDPEPMKEDQTGSDSGKLHVSLAGPNPEHMDDEFLATAYPKVHENLKLITDERVIDDKPESHSGSMSSMKNLDDTFNFGDQFLHDKPTEDDQEKTKVRERIVSLLRIKNLKYRVEGELSKAKKNMVRSSLQTDITANSSLYHALMEALITVDDFHGLGIVAVKVEDHKRKHD